MDRRLLRPSARGDGAPAGKRRRGGGGGSDLVALVPDDADDYAVTRYARAFGRDWWEVWAEAPLYRVLHACDRLDEVERIERLVEEGRDLRRAELTNMAFADGNALANADRRWRDVLRTAPGETPGTLSADDAATIARIMAGWNSTPVEVH